MNRKTFLKGLGIASVGMTLPVAPLSAKTSKKSLFNDDCVLIPSETAGPFPLDLTENQTFFRQNISEDYPGVPFKVRMKILGVDNCEPMPNVRVNIWHCDAEGRYSGYSTNNNPGQAGLTYCRGYQITDANGEVEFITIFPGWYMGRICHIHFQVAVSSSYAAVSQFTFPVDTKNEIYSANSTIYPGTDPMSLNQDNVFADGHEYQMATLEVDETINGYSSYIEVAVDGVGTTGVGHIERQTAEVFEVGQNFPNPYRTTTSIPITLKQASKLKVELWDLSGKKVATIMNEDKAVGEYNVDVNPSKLGLANGNYVYQIEAINSKGTFRLPKMMTFSK